jgi:hypothetical protein
MSEPRPAAGTLIQENLYSVAAVSPQDPRNAAARAVRGFLECQTFSVGGYDEAPDVSFRLAKVHIEWPDHHKNVTYPIASIVETPGGLAGHNLVPTPLEETVGKFGADTVLWKTSELVVDFQVDFWTNDNPTREAIAALLPVIFSPNEGQSSINVFAAPEYFSRPVRLLLLEQERFDDSEGAFSRIKRLKTTISASIEAVHLRHVTDIAPETSFDIGEGVSVSDP